MMKPSIAILGDELGLSIIKQAIPSIQPGVIIISENRVSARQIAEQWAMESHAQVLEQPAMRDAEKYSKFMRTISEIKPSIGLCMSYDKILSSEMLMLFSQGVFNVHGSLLPKYRGSNALNWVLVNGEKETGVTLHKMVEKVDAGPIVNQLRIAVDFDDTALTLQAKIIRAAGQILADSWISLCEGSYVQVDQDETKASCVSRRRPEDGQFDWDKPAMEIYNLIRALVKPWPGAWYNLDGQKHVIDSFISYDEVVQMQKEITGRVVEE